jgi:drug/metabolite transporter (DMT)-like permease
MSGAAIWLVLLAAAVHSSWNALAKRAHDQFLFLWTSVAFAGALFSPAVLWAAWKGQIATAGWGYVAGTGAIHAVYFFTLGRAYRAGDLSLVYPIARGLGIALVPVAGLSLLGESVSALGAAGIVLVVAGAAALGLVGRRAEASVEPRAKGNLLGTPRARAILWAVGNGITIAAYSLVDARGVRHLPPPAYISLLGLGCSLLLTPLVLLQRRALAEEWRRSWRTILLASTLNLTSYLLVLFAFRLAKTAYVVAARELSIVISTLVGVWLLREGRVGARIAGALVILSGVTCVVLAR